VTAHINAGVPASMTTVNREELARTPGVNLDDRLRQVPGFSLFRRSSSLVANPTTQGISLRGLGSTGASRTLVMWDGVPINDPFGGWVYWTRVAPEEIERTEVLRGSSTSVFGDRAMAGAIALFSREPDRLHIDGSYYGGNADTHQLGLGLSDRWGRFGASGRIRAFTTDGYFIVPALVRGPVDTEAGVRFVAANGRFDILGAEHRLFLKADILTEDRANGTVLTRNSTSLGTLSANYSWQHGHDVISAMGFHTREEFHASFTAIGAGRRTETLSYLQQVPSQGSGAAGFWSHSTSRWNTLAGADIERDQGTSTDSLYPAGLRIGGGNRLEHGVFGQVNFKAGPAQFFLGGRHHYTGGGNTFFSPSVGVVAGRGRWRVRGSAYKSFRAPTLNELYREFRGGNTVTQANAALRPETLAGGEAGFDFVGESRRLGVTLFRNSLEDLITNVTIRTTPSIIRQRQNAAVATSRGLEADFRQSWRHFTGELSYLYVESTYSTGLRIPQVPRSQGSAQMTYLRGGTLVSAGLRSYSLQFEDDLNQFILPGFATVQAAVRQRLAGRLSGSFELENLLDREYVVGFSPTPLVGAPRLFRIGLRWN
jgi:outer membrane receptor protein involved in Fe transport